MLNKRGQFYLVAALAIISIVIGMASMANSSRTTAGYKTIYEIEEELVIESEQVLDYGLVNNLDTITLMTDFTETFSNSFNEIEFYFIFGKTANLKAFKYFNGISEDVSGEISVVSEKILITVDGINYNFDLTQGENFYYIIFDETGGEKYVATNSN